jgi:hypothetical protein
MRCWAAVKGVGGAAAAVAVGGALEVGEGEVLAGTALADNEAAGGIDTPENKLALPLVGGPKRSMDADGPPRPVESSPRVAPTLASPSGR